MRLIALCENDDGQFWALRSHTSPLTSRDADGWIVATPERQFFATEQSELREVATAAVESLADQATEASVAIAEFSVQHDEPLPHEIALTPAESDADPHRLWIVMTPRRWIYLEGWRSAQLSLGYCPYDGLLEQAWREGFLDGGGQTLSLPSGDAGNDVAVMLSARNAFSRIAIQLPARSILRSGLHLEVDRIARMAGRTKEEARLRGIVHELRFGLGDAEDDQPDQLAAIAAGLQSSLDSARGLIEAGWTLRPPTPALGVSILLEHPAGTSTEAQAIIDAELSPGTLVDYFSADQEHHLLVAGEATPHSRPPGDFPHDRDVGSPQRMWRDVRQRRQAALDERGGRPRSGSFEYPGTDVACGGGPPWCRRGNRPGQSGSRGGPFQHDGRAARRAALA